MKILVTGGAGYIGSHICKDLFKKNFKVIVFENLKSGKKNFVKWGKFIKGDLTNFNQIKNAINKTKPNAIIHLAGKISVEESEKEIFTYYKNNFFGTLNLLEAMRINGIKKIVFSSTAGVYGNQKKTPISEKAYTNPLNIYSKTKFFSEELIKDYNRLYGINYFILRYFNAAGADFDCEIGESHDPETHLIPLAIDAILKNKRFKVFGRNFNTFDKTAIRDYIHVSDLASAHILALKKINKKNKNKVLNLGSQEGMSVLEVISLLEKSKNIKINKKFYKKRKGDIPKLISSSRLAKKVLGWKAKVSKSEILNSAYNWHHKNFKKNEKKAYRFNIKN